MTAELGNSSVPLTDDILEKKKDYVNTFDEFISKEGTLINTYAFTNGGVVNLYTVPKNHTLYISTLSLSVTSLGTTNSNASFGYVYTLLGTTFLRIVVPQAYNLTDSLCESYKPMIKLEEGQILRLSTGAVSVHGNAMLKGYIIKKDLTFT